ncbi:MAG: type-F conjugative transfer system pilin assembly protein TrbC [Alphaproteobacteria bacterium RIFCSPLOWO2_02_42_7]|nr:MAG: type-F conjugative transfer system pilin assembly protein TrbC [Alphaproteobacteria bacterium RIFCSPLOWO2_02_42_7]
MEEKELLRFLILMLLINSLTSSCSPCVANKIDAKTQSIELLQETSLKKSEELLKSPEFQRFVSDLTNQTLSACSTELSSSSLEKVLSHGNVPRRDLSRDNVLPSGVSLNDLYIFVSFSMGEKALLNLAKEAKDTGATLVLRGFKEKSILKTVKALEKVIKTTGQGFIIDPELFDLFAITAVPTFILSKPVSFSAQERIQTLRHDRLQGHVSVQYALETFAKEGDLKNEAQVFLSKNLHQRKDGGKK